MRKFLIAISVIALCILWTITIRATTGPEALPNRIPTHFDAAGNPNAWGSPNGLFLLPAIATAIFLIIGLISRKPESFNYPVRVTLQNRDRLQSLAVQMTAFLQAETVCLFLILQFAILHAFRAGHFALPPAVIPVGVVLILITTISHIVAMRRCT
ncbi:DUF1648 domain-containing protein [Acidicapsa acidisoli]|uniref:DUF1648 domain-containing protein n=1 Tax=Acidicapsa acidisoli TaxID=1615681 RepID=UPI0021E02C00|nr:DUF1648 domain-containing protein [Acidicapsa acidisoli]